MCARGCLVDRVEAVVDRQAEHRLRFEIVRILGDQLAQRRDVGGVGRIPRARRAARRLRLDVEPLARRHLVAQRHRFVDRFARADLRIDRGAVGRARDRRIRRSAARRRGGAAAVRRFAQQLERRAVVAGGAQRDAPVRHRHVRIELERLRARPLRFLEPERMNLRHALQEELARLFGLRRHRKVLGDAHPRQQLRRQQRLRARRHHAHLRLFLRLASACLWRSRPRTRPRPGEPRKRQKSPVS